MSTLWIHGMVHVCLGTSAVSTSSTYVALEAPLLSAQFGQSVSSWRGWSFPTNMHNMRVFPQYASKHYDFLYYPDPCMHIRELLIQPPAIVAPPSSLGRASLAKFQGSSLAHSKLNLVTFFIEPNVWSVSGRHPSRPSLFFFHHSLFPVPSTALSSE